MHTVCCSSPSEGRSAADILFVRCNANPRFQGCSNHRCSHEKGRCKVDCDRRALQQPWTTTYASNEYSCAANECHYTTISPCLLHSTADASPDSSSPGCAPAPKKPTISTANKSTRHAASQYEQPQPYNAEDDPCPKHPTERPGSTSSIKTYGILVIKQHCSTKRITHASTQPRQKPRRTSREWTSCRRRHENLKTTLRLRGRQLGRGLSGCAISNGRTRSRFAAYSLRNQQPNCGSRGGILIFN